MYMNHRLLIVAILTFKPEPDYAQTGICRNARSVSEIPMKIAEKEMMFFGKIIEQKGFNCGNPTFGTMNKTLDGRVVTIGCELGNMVILIKPNNDLRVMKAERYVFLFKNPTDSLPFCRDASGNILFER